MQHLNLQHIAKLAAAKSPAIAYEFSQSSITINSNNTATMEGTEGPLTLTEAQTATYLLNTITEFMLED